MAAQIKLSSFILSLPLLFLYWWYIEASVNILKYFNLALGAIAHIISIEIILKTFFKPWRSEFREGFVGVAILVGVMVRTFVLFADLIILSASLLIFVIIFLLWLILPVLPIVGIIYGGAR
ncbi:MAG: hypothetical protein A2Y57_03215 [Candidatus Woykebacteria bacterium RBG_13_40_7b]|uniref:Uncharacterized protein n=1 Tax=Candidatus Woykebacteria bacterium RBG_13_40_7b TaxID=1802594 RepID=A0A1G1W6Z8_9BACT|nr:MAG: hypothetical protein A2Y57_03215 [Candidatus Woykebacteria bacterium RBG_13_40_7b]